MDKGVVVDLLEEEIRHVGARDEPTCPTARINYRAIAVRFRSIRQDYGTRSPSRAWSAEHTFLHVLIVVDATQQQVERRPIKKAAVSTAIARPEARHADQPLDLRLLHRGDEDSRRCREKPRRR